MAKAPRCGGPCGEEARGEDRPADCGAGRDRASARATGPHRTASGNDGGSVGDHVKNARARGKSFEELAGRNTAHEALIATYKTLTVATIPTRSAALLTGLSRATATRKPRIPVPVPAAPPVPANKLNTLERARILQVVNSPEFVDLPPVQIYAQLLDEGVYLASTSTIYRALAENSQVRERRRQARHPARAIPELVATGPGQVYSCYADVVVMPI